MSHDPSYPYNWPRPPPQYLQPGIYEDFLSSPVEPIVFGGVGQSSREAQFWWPSSSFEMPLQALNGDVEMTDGAESEYSVHTPYASASTPNTNSSALHSGSARFAAEPFDTFLFSRPEPITQAPPRQRYVPIVSSSRRPVPIPRQTPQSDRHVILQGLTRSSPLNRTSTLSSQAFPGQPAAYFHYHSSPAGPWNQHNLRSERQQTPLDIHFETPEIAPPRPKKVAVRDGPLTNDQSRKAAENRRNGVCLRCRLFKEPCDGNTPCGACRKQSRTWTLGCVREWLDRRYDCLEPGLFQAFYTSAGLRRRDFALSEDSSWRSFNLHLNFGFDRDTPLIVEVLESGCQHNTASSSYGFCSGQWTQHHISYFRRKYLDPPVIPALYSTNHPEEVNRFESQIFTWIEHFLHRPNWKTQRFPRQYHYRLEYPRVILFFIADYYRNRLSEHERLRDALVLTLLNWTMTLSPEVPLENAKHLREWMVDRSWWSSVRQQPTHIHLYPHCNAHGHNDHRSPSPTPTKVLPHLVDHAIKTLLHKRVKPLTHDLLHNLQILLSKIHRNGGHDADIALSLCLLLLMQASRNQVRIWNESWLPEGVRRWRENDAMRMIRTIEEELVKVVICMAKRSLCEWTKKEGGGGKEKGGHGRSCESETRECSWR